MTRPKLSARHAENISLGVGSWPAVGGDFAATEQVSEDDAVKKIYLELDVANSFDCEKNVPGISSLRYPSALLL